MSLASCSGLVISGNHGHPVGSHQCCCDVPPRMPVDECCRDDDCDSNPMTCAELAGRQFEAYGRAVATLTEGFDPRGTDELDCWLVESDILYGAVTDQYHILMWCNKNTAGEGEVNFVWLEHDNNGNLVGGCGNNCSINCRDLNSRTPLDTGIFCDGWGLREI